MESALGESLVDDLSFLARQLGESSRENRASAVSEFLRQRIALPAEATFARFLELTRQALVLPGWDDYLARMRAEPPAWLARARKSFRDARFLEWLKESTDSQTRTRGEEGNHFYGRVHLLIYAQMTGSDLESPHPDGPEWRACGRAFRNGRIRLEA